MNIGIFAPLLNKQANSIFKILSNSNNCKYFDIDLTNDEKVSINSKGVYWNNFNICELDRIYVHNFSYVNPVIPFVDDNTDFSVWQNDYLVQIQKFSFFWSFFSELDRRGVQLINCPNILLKCFLKLDLLEDLRIKNFNVPKLICTNHMESLENFSKNYKDLLWRPATGRAKWQLFREKQKKILIKPESPPVMVCQLIEGPLVRCYLYCGKPLLFIKNSPPDLNPPEKLESVWGCDFPQFYDELHRFYKQTDIKWAVVNFVVNEDKMWIYDIDHDPIFNWLPDNYQNELINKFTKFISCDNIDELKIKITLLKREQRQVFFLKRMLRILFEFEKVKYPSK